MNIWCALSLILLGAAVASAERNEVTDEPVDVWGQKSVNTPQTAINSQPLTIEPLVFEPQAFGEPLSQRELTRAKAIRSYFKGIAPETLTDLEILGLAAKTPALRRKYARLFANRYEQFAQGVLKFDAEVVAYNRNHNHHTEVLDERALKDVVYKLQLDMLDLPVRRDLQAFKETVKRVGGELQILQSQRDIAYKWIKFQWPQYEIGATFISVVDESGKRRKIDLSLVTANRSGSKLIAKQVVNLGE